MGTLINQSHSTCLQQIGALNFRSCRVRCTPSAEVDRPTDGSRTLQRAGIQLFADEQVTHLKPEGKAEGFTIKTFKKLFISDRNRLRCSGCDFAKVSSPSHLVWPDTRGVEVGVSSPRVYGVMIKVFGNVFICCLRK